MTIKFYSKTQQGWTVAAPFEAMTFPGGEPHIKVTGGDTQYQYQIADLRGADSHDLFTLAMWADLVSGRGEERVVILPYLPGARADRGTPWGAAIYADFLTHVVGATQIITLDPHSPVMPGLIENYGQLTVFPFERIIKHELGDRGMRLHPYVGVIAPDKGAVDRASRAAAVLGVPVYRAEKTRDFVSGELTGFTCEPLPPEGKLLLVDDICDGGGTFVGLAKELNLPIARLDLWVTHGIFSKGLTNLFARFEHIYTTDSWGLTGIHDPRVTVIPVLPYLTGEINV